MKIRRITIEFDPEKSHPNAVLIAEKTGAPIPESLHATTLIFEQGAWTANGPVFSRFLVASHEIWQILRRSLKETGEAAP